MKRVLIIGATSAIAGAVARRFADNGAHLFLVARSAERLSAVADDLRVRGAASVDTLQLDVLDFSRHWQVVEAAVGSLGGLDHVLIAHGSLPDQRACERDAALAVREFNTNCVSVISLLTEIAAVMERQRSGSIAVISSVAGDRGRQSNYLYGAAKGALSVFLQGLRNRLYRAGVAVVTIKPGFVDTPMVADVPKNALFADPERVGKRIQEAMEKGAGVVYVPWFWRPIMVAIRSIPEHVFKRMRL